MYNAAVVLLPVLQRTRCTLGYVYYRCKIHHLLIVGVVGEVRELASRHCLSTNPLRTELHIQSVSGESISQFGSFSTYS